MHEKKFSCPFCQKAFSRTRYLENHAKVCSSRLDDESDSVREDKTPKLSSCLTKLSDDASNFPPTAKEEEKPRRRVDALSDHHYQSQEQTTDNKTPINPAEIFLSDGVGCGEGGGDVVLLSNDSSKSAAAEVLAQLTKQGTLTMLHYRNGDKE